jgi:hypothetical protein
MVFKGRVLIIALVVGMGLVTNPENGVSSPSPTSTTVTVGDEYCWFCWKFEDTRYNLLTMQNEWVTVAFCVTEDNLQGGAVICNSPSNQFDYEGVYHGGHCTMYQWYGDGGWEACDCSRNNEGGFDELWTDDCWSESPASALSFDGYMTDAVIAMNHNDGEDSSSSSCTGVLTERSFGSDVAALGYSTLRRLVL